MRLFFCSVCDDVQKLQYQERRCLCGRAAGKYAADGLSAEVSGSAISLGIENQSFREAIMKHLRDGRSSRFDAFVISGQPPNVTSFERSSRNEL